MVKWMLDECITNGEILNMQCYNTQIYMLRITNLIRGRIPKRIPMRAGIPNWDRPDPPPSVRVQPDHEFTDQQIYFSFPDPSMPEFIFTQPQIYQGDNVIQAAPSFLRNWGFYLAITLAIGTTAYFMNPGRTIKPPTGYKKLLSENNKRSVQQKQWQKFAQQNPIGIKITAQNYDPLRFANNPLTKIYQATQQSEKFHLKVNKQVQSYLRAAKQKAKSKVASRLAGHGNDEHGHKSHEQHSQHEEKHHKPEH